MSDDAFPQKSSKPQFETADPIFSNADYKPILSNWFTAKPFGFRFTPKNGEAKVMYLPIGLSNLIITTQFATNVTSTIYGTVEEHSPVRYFDISIEGTTGMGPKYTAPMSPNQKPDIKQGTMQPGRSAFTIQQSFSNAGAGFFAKTIATADKAIKDISSLLGKSAVTGLQLDQTGYIAFHNLYRFFLKYKKDVSGTDDKDPRAARKKDAKHPLVFFNYKDNNEYNVVIKTFTLRRDKENPMLYYYSITMRGYELKTIAKDGINGVTGTEEILAALGLDGVKGSSFLGKAKEITSEAKSILGSVANGVNQLGR